MKYHNRFVNDIVQDRRKYMRLACLNINGLTDQSKHDVNVAIEAKGIDIFSLVETKLKSTDREKINFPGFEVIESRREPGEKQGGGLACLLRKSAGVSFSRLNPKIENENLQYVDKERMWVTYKSQKGSTAVATVYLGFNSTDNRHTEWNRGIYQVLSEEIRELRGRGYRVILNGDFNSWVGNSLSDGGIPGNYPPQPNTNGIMFLEFLERNSLRHINGATRVEGDWSTRVCEGLWTRHSGDHRSSTVLDYAVVSSEHLTTVKEMHVDEGGKFGGHSDHNMFFLTVQDHFMSIKKIPRPHKPGWDLHENTDMSKFQRVVQRELDSLEIANIGPGVDGLSDGLTAAVIKGLNEGVGRRSPPPERKQLFPKHIVSIMKERKALESKFKTLKCLFASSNLQTPPESLLVAREALDSKSEELESAKSKFYRQKRAPLMNLSKDKTRNGRKKFWRFVSGRTKTESDIEALQDMETGILKHTPGGIADEIRKYLKTIFSGHNEDPGLDFEDRNHPDQSEEQTTPPNRDHEYGAKTHAQLPQGGQGVDPVHNPTGYLNKPITTAEVLLVINNLKPGKSAGHDDVVNEALKGAPKEFVEKLTCLFNRVKDQSRVPESWKRGRVVLIHKKGSKTDAGNYRPITVLTAIGGVYSKILNARLTEVVERHQLLGEVQHGFRKGRSGADSAFVLNTVLWKSLAKQKKVHLSFLDLAKAYDSVDRSVLWSKMRKLGFRGKFLDSIISMYKGDYVTSQSNGVTTDPVFLGRGLRQGCSLSPLLFALYVVDLSRDLVASRLGVILRKVCVSVLFFADDIVLISKTPEGLRALHGIVQKHCDTLKMAISITKSKVMSSSSDLWEIFQDQEIIGCLEKVLQFRYLGVETRLYPSKAAKAMQQRALSISKKYKGACLSLARDGPDIVDLAASLWQNIALPSLLFGCETVPFSASSIDEISRHQSSIGKFSLGLPFCSPNVSAEVILGMKPFKQLLYASQLKFYAKLSTQEDSRWSKDALLDHVLGGWDSPYIKYIGAVKEEVGMRKWPINAKHVDAALNRHFLLKTNSEIERLSTPALEPLAKRARMEHVDESEESQVMYPK